MENQRRIDCHTHIVNQKIKDAYYQNPGGYAIIMEFLPQFANAQDVYKRQHWSFQRIVTNIIINTADEKCQWENCENRRKRRLSKDSYGFGRLEKEIDVYKRQALRRHSRIKRRSRIG